MCKLTFIGELIQSYFQVDGADLGERNPKWLQDDYVKFLRFAQWRIEKTGHGIVAFITNHGYLDNPTFRGMRRSLMQTFDTLYFYDLHGNAKKKERAPDGGEDKNVFDIQQGVAICVLVKRPASSPSAAPPVPNSPPRQNGKPEKKGNHAEEEGNHIGLPLPLLTPPELGVGGRPSRLFHADLYGPRLPRGSVRNWSPCTCCATRPSPTPASATPFPATMRYRSARPTPATRPPTDAQPGRVWLNATQYFDNVTPEAWAFRFGGYQPAAKWLDDRAGRRLTAEEITHYRRALAAMRETHRRLPDADAAFTTILEAGETP